MTACVHPAVKNATPPKEPVAQAHKQRVRSNRELPEPRSGKSGIGPQQFEGGAHVADVLNGLLLAPVLDRIDPDLLQIALCLRRDPKR